jgi:hypothetical protein
MRSQKLIIFSFILAQFVFSSAEAQEISTKMESTGWTKMSIGADIGLIPKIDLQGISGVSKKDIFAVGIKEEDAGIILHYDGDGNNDDNPDEIWEELRITKSKLPKLHAVWGESKIGVYAAGDGGTILYGSKGINWSFMSMPKSERPAGNFYGIWGSSVNDVFAVGAAGIILHYDGDGNNDGKPDNLWESMSSNTTVQLNAVWGSAPDNVFAVGANGIILHYDGDGNDDGKRDRIWQAIKQDAQKNLNSVWGITGSVLFVVGDEGTILFTKDRGKHWIRQEPESISLKTTSLKSIWGASPGTVFAVGEAGTVLHYNYDKETWNEVQKPADKRLNAVWVSKNPHVFVVGVNGIIYEQGLTGYFWMAGKICSACSGEGIPQATVCEVVSPTQCNSLQNGTTDQYGYYGRNQFSSRSHTFRFSKTGYITEERSVNLMLNCSISNNTFLFKETDYRRCIAGVVSKTCDSYDWYIGSPTQSVTVKLDKAIGCEMPGTYDFSTTADPYTGLYHFSNLDDGIYKIKVEADGCSFTPETTCVVTIPLTSRKAHNFKGTGTGLCACPVPSQVPAQCQ